MYNENELSILRLTDSYVHEYSSEAIRSGSIHEGSHGEDHGRRVGGLSRIIAIGEGQNPYLPTLAGFIHDLGRAKTDDPRSKNSQHGILSIEIARDFLEELPISHTERDLIIEAVEDHPFLNNKVRRNGLVEILQDADRCDGLGPITPIKVAQYKPLWPLHPEHICQEIPDQLGENLFDQFVFVREWYDMLWTKTARNMIKNDVEFLDEYMKRYNDQLKWYQQAYTDTSE